MPQYKVMIAQFPGGNVVHPDCAAWVTHTVLQMHQDPRIGPDNCLSFRMSSTPITMVRNKSVMEALKAGADYLLMIDNDVCPDVDVGDHPHAKPFWPNAFDWALEHRDTPCNVAAPYGGCPPREAVFVATYKNMETGHPDPDWKLGPMPREWAAIKTGFEAVGALATGLLLIDMRMFHHPKYNPKGKLPPPYFNYEWADEKYMDEMITTEDYFFTRNCAYLGYPQYVFWDAWCGHWKPKLVRRPEVLPVDHVVEDFRKACANNYREDTRLVMVKNGQPQNGVH